MKWCIRLILFLTSILCIRNYLQNNKQTGAFQEDVRYYFNALREYHPAPYLHISRDSLMQLEPEILNECKNFPNLIAFNLRLMQCNHLPGYHSNINLYSFTGQDPSLDEYQQKLQVPASYPERLTQPDIPFIFQSEDRVSLPEMKQINHLSQEHSQ